MAVHIREADLHSDRRLIIELLYRHLTRQSDGYRFDWLYLNNPFGQARVWIATDIQTRSAVGMVSAFPRRIYIRGREELGWVLGDFCIHEKYRSLGPALQLQRACFAAADSARVAFCYDFPSLSMTAIYQRLQIHPFGQMVRLARPLRVDRKVREMVKIPILAQGLSKAGNLLLRLYDPYPGVNPALTISFLDGKFGEEFSLLAQEVGSRYEVCLQRSAEYLNWRYLANPLGHYEVLTARQGEALLAYVIFAHTGEDAALVDLFGIQDHKVIKSLVNYAGVLLRKRGVITVSISLLASHPWVALLQDSGFKAREASPVVVYTSSLFTLEPMTFDPGNWFLIQGDRDS
ncbi:MAG TPA: GNAT family N-acetyltransferase [Candidatus Limnocylindrales bacterium]|nr:GNAT family N-acetyltransferase [Candidatus Limnocylindrales bacterium]